MGVEETRFGARIVMITSTVQAVEIALSELAEARETENILKPNRQSKISRRKITRKVYKRKTNNNVYMRKSAPVKK